MSFGLKMYGIYDRIQYEIFAHLPAKNSLGSGTKVCECIMYEKIVLQRYKKNLQKCASSLGAYKN